jgi:hypothetical protein
VLLALYRVAVPQILEEGVPEIAVGQVPLLGAAQEPEPAAVPELSHEHDLLPTLHPAALPSLL